MDEGVTLTRHNDYRRGGERCVYTVQYVVNKLVNSRLVRGGEGWQGGGGCADPPHPRHL
jgi:hypothetical protein